jgi:hypothetical protein
MDPKFKEAVDQLHGKYERLVSMMPVKTASLPNDMPLRGVYLFSIDEKPLYVGRSNNMRRRLLGHGGAGSKEETAAFAFKLARKRTGFTTPSYKKSPESRAGLMQNPAFKQAFDQAKAEIQQKMVSVRRGR